MSVAPEGMVPCNERQAIAAETNAHALKSAIWLALFHAERAGWPEAVDRLSELHAAAAKREQEQDRG